VLAPGEELTLYVDAFWSSPFDFSCFVALTEKQLLFGTVRALVREGQGLLPVLKERTVTARIPALAHGDFWLSESQAVVEYLEDVFPPPAYAPLLPAEPRARARARQVMGFLRADLHALRRERPSQMVFYPFSPPPLGKDAEGDARELIELAGRLVAAPEFAGAWSIAHADLAFALLRLSRTGYAKIPARVEAFIAEECARPSVRAYLDHPRPPHPPE
jgi:glutathione S-transferase